MNLKVVELILELYCEIAKKILCYFTPSESKVPFTFAPEMVPVELTKVCMWNCLPLIAMNSMNTFKVCYWHLS